jgi:hypothetical protein
MHFSSFLLFCYDTKSAKNTTKKAFKVKLKHIQEIFKNISQKLPIDLKTSEVFKQEFPFIFKSYSIFFQYDLKQIHVFLEKKGFNSGYFLEDECFKKLGLGEISFEDLLKHFKAFSEDFVRSTKICTAVWTAYWIEKGEYHHFPLKVEIEQLWLRILTQVFFEIDIKQPTLLKSHLLSIFEYTDQIIQKDELFSLPSLFQKWKYAHLCRKFKKSFKQETSRQGQHPKVKELKWLNTLEAYTSKPIEHSLLFLWYLVQELTHLSVRFIETQQADFHAIKLSLQSSQTMNDHHHLLISAMQRVVLAHSFRLHLLINTQSRSEKLCIFPSLIEAKDQLSDELGLLERYFYLQNQKLEIEHPIVILMSTFLSVLLNRVMPLVKDEEIDGDPSYQLYLHPGDLHIPSDHVKKR